MDRVKENEIYDKFQDLCNSHKDMILSDDKHLCNTECPLRDTNRCENVFFYQQGKADGAREFADRLRVNFDLYAWKNSDEVIDYTLAEMQKGEENESSD